jgi:hypothetical protein
MPKGEAAYIFAMSLATIKRHVRIPCQQLRGYG